MISFSRSLLISAVLLVLAATSLLAAAQGRFDVEITQTLVFAAGLLSMAFLSSLSQLSLKAEERLELDFSPSLARIALEDAIPAEFEEVQTEASWEMFSDALMSEDPALALAKTRIDLEREVRRIASEANLRSDRPFTSMLQTLAKEEVLPPQLYHAIRDVLPALNQAIHGHKVDQKQAREVIDLGADILKFLRGLNGGELRMRREVRGGEAPV